MTDTIADMLTRIRNASKVKKTEAYIPFSKIKLEMIKILNKEGYIAGFDEIKPGSPGHKFGGIMVQLKYDGAEPAISAINRISSPGRRIYVPKDNLPKVLNNLGVAILSTSQGIMTNKEARRKGLGGEVLCEIY